MGTRINDSYSLRTRICTNWFPSILWPVTFLQAAESGRGSSGRRPRVSRLQAYGTSGTPAMPRWYRLLPSAAAPSNPGARSSDAGLPVPGGCSHQGCDAPAPEAPPTSNSWVSVTSEIPSACRMTQCPPSGAMDTPDRAAGIRHGAGQHRSAGGNGWSSANRSSRRTSGVHGQPHPR